MNNPAENQYANHRANTFKNSPICRPFRTSKFVLPDRGLKPSSLYTSVACIRIRTYASAGNAKKLRHKLQSQIIHIIKNFASAYPGAGG